MKKNLLLPLLLLSLVTQGQLPQQSGKPKLIVGIVVDQMRYDLLWKYWDLYGDGGFRKLVNDGFLCRNARFNYLLTVTAAGHATIYSGTIPAVHGVMENNYYDRAAKSDVYMMSDPEVLTVGNETSAAGMSPVRLMSTTVTDELKLASRQSKVIGIALKDRSAMLPAGHFADGAYYFDGTSGRWISSTWYMKALPAWLVQYNKSNTLNDYLQQDWKLLLPRSAYAMCTGDTVPYEKPMPGESLPIFPHKLGKDRFSILPYTPFGNTITKNLAMETIRAEKLGKRNVTDFLCISFSSTDIVSHSFGPNSLETADCYIRLDRDLAELLKGIEEVVGKENALVFLTADHGGAINPQFGQDHNLHGGIMLADSLVASANHWISEKLGAGTWISAMTTQQVYLNREFISRSKHSPGDVAQAAAAFLMQQEGVLCVYAPGHAINFCNEQVEELIMNGYYPERSGDLFYTMKAGWIDWYSPQGTSHGTIYSYDNHVPLIWYGWKIPHGTSLQKVVIPDIAPTISSWLDIPFPSGTLGNPIPFIPLK